MTRRGIVVNKTEYPATQALMPKPIAIWDFPLWKVYDKGNYRKFYVIERFLMNAWLYGEPVLKIFR